MNLKSKFILTASIEIKQTSGITQALGKLEDKIKNLLTIMTHMPKHIHICCGTQKCSLGFV